MKILLLGEFSGLHKYLKDGLQKIGEDVTLYSNGNGWKKIPGADGILFRTNGNCVTDFIHANIDPLYISRKFSNYDVVQLINTITFYQTVNVPIIKRIKKHNKCLSLISAGYDTRMYEKYKEGFFDYSMMDDAYSILDSFDSKHFKGKVHQWNDHRIEDLVDIIIPSAYEYSVGYISSNKAAKVIPFPVSTDEIVYTPNNVGNKIVIFHGLNREIEKGTQFIKHALDQIERDYPDDVEIIIKGHMPFDEYQKIIKKANIIIDQCKSYGYGINACLSMAMGKVVMSGARPEHLESLGVSGCPIIPIFPDANQIYIAIKEIIENKQVIPEIGNRSRQYVEETHRADRIAMKYVETWKNTIDRKAKKHDNA